MSSYDESLKVTCELLRRRVEGGREVRPSDHIQKDLGLDSLAVMEFASDVENRFGISIPSEMLDRLSTVEDVSRAVLELAGPDALK
jgi:acyl carrier protein